MRFPVVRLLFVAATALPVLHAQSTQTRLARFYQPHREKMTEFVKGISSDAKIKETVKDLAGSYKLYVEGILKESVPQDRQYLIEHAVTDEYVKIIQALTSLGCVALADELASSPDAPNSGGARSVHMVAARSLHEDVLSASLGNPFYTDCSVGNVVENQARHYCLAKLKGDPLKFFETRLRAELWRASVEDHALYHSTDPDIDEDRRLLASNLSRFPERRLLSKATRDPLSKILESTFDAQGSCFVLASRYVAGRPPFENLSALWGKQLYKPEEGADESVVEWLARQPKQKETVLSALGARSRLEWQEWWDFLEGMNHTFITNSLGMELVESVDIIGNVQSPGSRLALEETQRERIPETWMSDRVIINHYKRVWEAKCQPVPVTAEAAAAAEFEPEDAKAFAKWLTQQEVKDGLLHPKWCYRPVPVKGTKLFQLALLKSEN